jgi:hydroxymethylpyrimidine pyrophosphatase-like HAD family hydrolase
MMRFKALATDYDGTLAHDGLVDAATLHCLRQLRQSGRKVIMVTGRELPELLLVCADIGLFDLVVAENGAVLYDPESAEETVLAPSPSEVLVARLRAEGVPGISVGRSIIALWKPHEVQALEAIRDLGLELHIVFNKEAVMILPSTVNKATGLAAALKRLSIDARDVVGIGDAENDHAFIAACGFGVAVANAIPSLKESVELVTSGARGEGVRELVRQMLHDDLAALIARHADAISP